MVKMLTALPVLLALVLAPAVSALAEPRDTLKEIDERGRIRIGFRELAVPFAFQLVEAPLSPDPLAGRYTGVSTPAPSTRKVLGYSIEYAERLATAIKKELNRPDLAVEYVPVTAQNRLPLLAEKAYDFECGSTTNNTVRQKEAAFSNSIFVIGTRLLTGRDSGIQDYADLAGKTLVVAAGSTSERLIGLMNESEKLGVTVVRAGDQSEAFRWLEEGRADAFFYDDALLAGERSKAADPEAWVIVGQPQTFEAYGCLLPLGDAAFKTLVDAVIADIQTSGEGLEIYAKWFQNPIPPRGLNMGFELSAAMEHLLSNPNDQPYQ